MFGNCDQIVTIPSTTNQWPHPHQNQIDDCKGSRASSMDQKPAAQQQQQQQTLKCPRCDSSNTKFCYYNNYSLSQPRHFCKACKRYWTRGGTLRNVPVGGGCRRNKRTLIKRSSDTSSSSSLSTNSTPSNNVSHPHIDNTPSSSMFHGFSSSSYNPCDHVNLPFSRLFNYDLNPQANNNNATGLGFSSGFMSTEAQNGFTSYGSIFRSSSSSSSTSASSSVMPNSMLNNSNMLVQQKLINHGSFKDGSISNTFQGLEQMQTGIGNGNSETALKDQIQHVGLYDPSLYWNNNTPSLMGLWNIDQPNLGPSVTSFI